MINTGDYPDGAANDPKAPYNEVKNPEVEVDLYVWYNIGKPIKIRTSDYEIDEWDDEDGHHWKPDFRTTDFWSLIEEQCPAPKNFEILEEDFTIEQ